MLSQIFTTIKNLIKNQLNKNNKTREDEKKFEEFTSFVEQTYLNGNKIDPLDLEKIQYYIKHNKQKYGDWFLNENQDYTLYFDDEGVPKLNLLWLKRHMIYSYPHETYDLDILELYQKISSNFENLHGPFIKKTIELTPNQDALHKFLLSHEKTYFTLQELQYVKNEIIINTSGVLGDVYGDVCHYIFCLFS